MLYGTESSVETSNSLGVQEVHRCLRKPILHDRIQNLRLLEYIPR